MQSRKCVRILLIDQNKNLLLMRVVDPSTTSIDRKARAAFWCTIGGGIEADESLEMAVYRELYEETGLTSQEVCLGPVVWFGKHRMIISGREQEKAEQFILVTTAKTVVTTENLTDAEQGVVTRLEWLSLDAILDHAEPIFPVILKTHLAPILDGKIPPNPIWVDLGQSPDNQ